MIRRYKLLLIALCLSLVLFKALTAHRFIENGIKRAEIYADYNGFVVAQQTIDDSNLSDGKNAVTSLLPIHMVGIIVTLIFFIAQINLMEVSRPVNEVLKVSHFLERIFKPPKNTYTPV
jgi:hypothetical protein